MTATFLLVLSLLLAVAVAQIPVGWAPPCKITENVTSNYFSINFLDNCDMYHAPHIANPFLLYMLTGSWLASFFVPGAFEIVEAIVFMIKYNTGDTSVAPNVYENLPDILIDDWLIQAGLGTLLGAWVFWMLKPPVLWGNWYTDRGGFMWSLGWYALLLVPQLNLFPISLSDDTPIGFPLGPMIAMGVTFLIFMAFIEFEPRRWMNWAGRSELERMTFWAVLITVYFSFWIVVMFDFFYGSAPQTWLLWGVWIILIFVWLLCTGRGSDVLQLLQWQQNYIRRRAEMIRGYFKV